MTMTQKTMSSFFGLQVSPGAPAYYRPDEDCPSVRVKKATLSVVDDGRGAPSGDGERVLVKCRVEKGPPHVLASLIPGRVENAQLDALFADDVRISVSVVAAATAAAASSETTSETRRGDIVCASRASETTTTTTPSTRYVVHLVGNVEYDPVAAGGAGGDGSDDEDDGEAGEESESESESDSGTMSEEDRDETQSEASSESWGSGDDMDVDVDDGGANDGGGGVYDADGDAAVAARRAAAAAGAATGKWKAPDVSDATAMALWDAPETKGPNGAWAYHIQNSGARQHRRQATMPTFKWTGDLRPAVISPRRRVPSVGWLAPLPDYARSGWPEAEFNSPLQHKLEVKTPEQLDKMRAACSLGRAVMDAVAAAIAPGVTTDHLDRICHVMTVMNGAYPSPRNYMGFPKSLCTSVNEVVCHGIPDARPLQDGDIVNLDITVCLNGYHGDLNETYMVGTGARDTSQAERSKKLMTTALECLEIAIAECRPGVRFRDIGELIQAHGNEGGYGVVKDFCGHGIGSLFHCAPNVPHYARNKAVGVMKPGMTFTIEPMLNEGSHKCKHWPDGWTAVTIDGGRSAQYEHTLAVTATGVEVLTARTRNSRPFYDV